MLGLHFNCIHTIKLVSLWNRLSSSSGITTLPLTLFFKINSAVPIINQIQSSYISNTGELGLGKLHFSDFHKNARRMNHLGRTSDKPRDPNIYSMTISQIRDLSPTVKEIVLTSDTKPAPFSFKAGQWVDLFVPGIEKIGGFTITSSSVQLKANSSFNLAIQYSNEQPAFWVHTKCIVNDQVSIRVGGDFFYDPSLESSSKEKLLLIAGGVGINPLIAIINEVHMSNSKVPIAILCSAKSEQELLFKEHIQLISSESNGNIISKFFVTQNHSARDEQISFKRIDRMDIAMTLHELDKISSCSGDTKTKVYICGPPPMISDMEKFCCELNLNDISYEKWW